MAMLADVVAKVIEDLTEERDTLRRMFDTTRHRMCDAMGVDRGNSWSSLESIARERRPKQEP